MCHLAAVDWTLQPGKHTQRNIEMKTRIPNETWKMPSPSNNITDYGIQKLRCSWQSNILEPQDFPGQDQISYECEESWNQNNGLPNFPAKRI